jgi:quercetin dioxygenase-like cupin family protein
MKNDETNIADLTGQSNHTDKSNLTGNSKQIALTEIEKSKVHIIVEIIEYVPNAVVSMTIIKKTTGNITVSSFAIGEELAEKTSPFDNYIQIIDGAAEVVIENKKYQLKLGEGIVIPAHAPHCFNANVQFKMICTIIKSGYED